MKISVTRRQGNFIVDASFQGAPTGVTALYGQSGAGKTSIVNMVAGLARPDSGRIAVNGLCLFDGEQGIDLPPERRRIGYVFQDGRLLPHLSVKANLTYGMRLTPGKSRFINFDSVVDLLGIPHLLYRRPAKLSGGEKQRVAIGRALLTSPAMLLMDEPLASLDASRKDEVLPFIMRLSREFSIPILYVSHAMDEILNLADQLVVMEAGKVLAFGKMTDLLSRPELRSYFGRDSIGSVIQATIEEQKDNSGLTCLRFGSRRLKVAPIAAPRGASVRVRIAARHVAIALMPPDKTSFQNVFSGPIDQIVDHGDYFVDIRLNIGYPLWARITRKSYRELDLKPGASVYALVKSVGIALGGGVEGTPIVA
jgi:molybdate transport system ATP-binding protein